MNYSYLALGILSCLFIVTRCVCKWALLCVKLVGRKNDKIINKKKNRNQHARFHFKDT